MRALLCEMSEWINWRMTTCAYSDRRNEEGMTEGYTLTY